MTLLTAAVVYPNLPWQGENRLNGSMKPFHPCTIKERMEICHKEAWAQTIGSAMLLIFAKFFEGILVCLYHMAALGKDNSILACNSILS